MNAAGELDPQGFCPKKPKAVRSSTASPSGGSAPRQLKAKPDCKYGPRVNAITGELDPQGVCPKKPPATVASGVATRAQRRLETAAGTAAANVAKTVIKTIGPGNVVRAIAKASLVGLAGLAAYKLTSKLLTLKAKTWQDLRNEISAAFARAKTEAIKERGLTFDQVNADPELRKQLFGDLQAYYKDRMRILEAQAAKMPNPPANAGNLYFSDD